MQYTYVFMNCNKHGKQNTAVSADPLVGLT